MTATLTALATRGASDLRKLAEHCESLEAENNELRAKVASFERTESAREIAAEMEQKGLLAGKTFNEKVASVLDYESLDDVRRAVGLTTGSGGSSIKLAEVASSVDAGPNPQDDFYHFCVTGESPND